MTLTDQQSENIMKVWNAYLDDGEKYVYPVTGFTHAVMDQHRLEVIPELKSWLEKFIYGSITVDEFKTKVEEVNKANLLWGFIGVNGQTFFNLVAGTSLAAKLQSELINLFKETLPTPVTIDFSVNNIQTS